MSNIKSLAQMQEQLNTLKLRCQTQQIMLRKLSREKQDLLNSNAAIKKDLVKMYENIMEENSLHKSLWGTSSMERIIDDMMTLIMTIETGENGNE